MILSPNKFSVNEYIHYTHKQNISNRMTKLKVCVIGGGVIGLSTAVNIADNMSNVDVDIIAEKFSPDTTSDIAGGWWEPHDVKDLITDRDIHQLAEITFHHIRQLSISEVAWEAGAFILSGYSLSRYKQEPPVYKDMFHGHRELSKAELDNFPGFSHGFTFMSLVLECNKYLPWLTKRFCDRGGRVIKRKVNFIGELAKTYDIAVNCSGLGARDLVNDPEVTPARGQMVRVQAPWIKHCIIDQDNFAYILPRSDYVLLGGSYEEGCYDTTPSVELRERILTKCRALVPSLKCAKFERDLVGLRPCRPNIRLEAEEMSIGDKNLQVIHNYGHSGSGVTLHWGCALKATSLVQEAVQRVGNQAKLYLETTDLCKKPHVKC